VTKRERAQAAAMARALVRHAGYARATAEVAKRLDRSLALGTIAPRHMQHSFVLEVQSVLHTLRETA
jgi:hypothetical protein